MKNRYFSKLRHDNIRAEKNGQKRRVLTKGQHDAFAFWAIAEHYDSEDIFIDRLPEKEDIQDFFEMYRAAGVRSLIFALPLCDALSSLEGIGLLEGEECLITRKETKLYQGKPFMLKGRRYTLCR